MSDMELVIKMPEEMYKWVNDVNKFFDDYGISDFIDLVKHGTPIQKGHDRLIDAKAYEQDIRKHYFDNELVIRSTEIALSNAPTIIEADTESEG